MINASLCWSLGGLQHLRKCCCQTRLGLGPCRTRSRGVLTQHKAELLLSCCSLPGSPGSIGGEGSSRCGREADSAARTSKSQSHFWLRSKIRFPNQINPCFCYVSSCLTFSSIPPFRTGSGSGPAGMGEDTRISDQTPKNTTLVVFSGPKESSLSSTIRAPLCWIRSLSAAHLSFHQHLLTPLHSTGMSCSSIIHTWFIFYEMVLQLLVLDSTPPPPPPLLQINPNS